jgi:hypothetical protein
MFDHNQMNELSHLKAARYAHNGGGGGFKVATSTKAYYEARGIKELSPFARAAFEAREAFRIAARGAISDFTNAANEFDLLVCERKDAARVALANIPF